MTCIYCGNPTKVMNSRKTVRSNETWRRRVCTVCGAVFTTAETVDFTRTFMVEEQSGNLVPFLPEKLLISLYDSLRHRSTAITDAQALHKTVINQIVRVQHTEPRPGVVQAATIKRCALRSLQRFDSAAATHYTAYHPEKSQDRL